MASASVVGAQTLQTLYSFSFSFNPLLNGLDPLAALTLGTDGNFYGTTAAGGSGSGTVFRVTASGALTNVAVFDVIDGVNPEAALTLGNDGNFYGTTVLGGIVNSVFDGGMGMIYQLTTNGTLNALAVFDGTNGADPQAALTLGSDGNFYGTTALGGSNGLGTVFKVTTNGTLTTLVSFGLVNGAYPRAALTLGSDGNFYGTTQYGGNTNLNSGSGYGAVFKVTTNGTLTTLVSFSNTNGANPQAGLTLGNDGNLYGTTYGGVSGDYYYYGTAFRVTPNATLTTLVSFSNTNGAYPNALTLGSDGNLYGTTFRGGNGYGTVFRLLLPPVIIVQPQNQTNNAGATVTFLVNATSLQPLGYQWQKNGTNLVNGGNISGGTETIWFLDVFSG